jgi:cytochrome P450
MHAETQRAFLEDGNFRPAQFKHLKLTRDVFRETLRLYPPVSFVPRDITVPETMRGKNLKKGSAIFISLWLMQRHREIWKNPDMFDPDRFSREDEKEAIRSAYMPFSQGPRVCLGASFALQEAAIILSMIAHHYEITPVEGHVPKPVARLTLRSENGIRLRLRKRS